MCGGPLSLASRATRLRARPRPRSPPRDDPHAGARQLAGRDEPLLGRTHRFVELPAVEIGAAEIDANAVTGRLDQGEAAPLLVHGPEGNEKGAVELLVGLEARHRCAGHDVLNVVREVAGLRLEPVRN